MLPLPKEVTPYQFFLKSGKLFTFHNIVEDYETSCFLVIDDESYGSLSQLVPLRLCQGPYQTLYLTPTRATLWMDRRQFCGYSMLPLTVQAYEDDNIREYSTIEDCIPGTFTLPKQYDEVLIWTAFDNRDAASYLYLEIKDLSQPAKLHMLFKHSSQWTTLDLAKEVNACFEFENCQELMISRKQHGDELTGKFEITRKLTW